MAPLGGRKWLKMSLSVLPGRVLGDWNVVKSMDDH